MTSKYTKIGPLAVAAAIIFAQAACGGGANAPAPPSAALLTPDSAALAAVAPDSFDVVFETSKGNFTVRARRAWAPIGVDRFHYLVANGFYNDARFFRVMPGFIVQIGMSAHPKVTAVWDTIKMMDEPVVMGNRKGLVTYAKTQMPNSRGTQIFINYADNTPLDAMGFSAFGEVIDGMSVVESLHSGYGESPDQGQIAAQGHDYLIKSFPQLDYVKSTKVSHH